MGGNSTVSEIEPPEVIDQIATISPDLTHEELEEVKPIEQPTTGHPNEIDVVSGQSSDPNALDQEEPEEPEEVLVESENQQTVHSTGQKKRRRKGKVNEFQEDNTIDEDFASRLDMSCIDGTAAPSVDDAYVVEYIR